MMDMLRMPIHVCNHFIENVAPYFNKQLIYYYCLSIDEKEQKGLCSNDLKRDLLRMITFHVGEDPTEEQRKAIEYVEKCIVTYDEKIESLWRELQQVENLEGKPDSIASDFYMWERGTCKFDIWNWFDYHHSKGVSYLLYEI